MLCEYACGGRQSYRRSIRLRMPVMAASWPIHNTKFYFKRANFIADISRRNFAISSSSLRSNLADTSAIRRSS
jgi:hypothetical protein